MFDTNIFDRIVKNEIDISPFVGKIAVYATHIQYDELNATGYEYKAPNGEPLREQLIKLFHTLTKTLPTESGVVGISKIGASKIAGNVVATESAVWDVSRWDEAKWGGNAINTSSAAYGVSRYGKSTYGGSNLCKDIWEKLDKRAIKDNNSKDALIAETAILNDLILVTHDRILYEVVTKDFKARAESLDDLFNKINAIRT
ncbi:MAG: hypothetical protein WAO98_07815 [Alphaproteobacteria bacterium]